MPWLRQALLPITITSLILGSLLLFWGREMRQIIGASPIAAIVQTQPPVVKRHLNEISQYLKLAERDLNGRLNRLLSTRETPATKAAVSPPKRK